MPPPLPAGRVPRCLQVWDHLTGRLKLDLPYQAEEQFMLHDSAVLAAAFSRDSELLATGDQDGRVKVWRVRTGQCLRRFDSAHSQGVTSLAFSRDGTHVLSASYDTLVRWAARGVQAGGARRVGLGAAQSAVHLRAVGLALAGQPPALIPGSA